MPNCERSTEDVPTPSPVAILFRIAMTHWLATMPKSEAIRVLRNMAEDLATEESLSGVLLLRPPPEQSALNAARRQALAMYHRFLPVWLAALDGDEE